ncbi:alkaline ceramidase TOD1 isoform X2 [Magnolia sinica]|uniref:alkaline ceramidase TOD1 isoform X2 n=1 Tax=Magnolia sinica TaxID=86752 RepID=UPI002657D742|nr:alkaline ceramidase TOD1 isoform X2 [Magnolia sinica]
MPTPPLFQSKLLCFSLFYLFTALFLSLYASLSNTKCIFQSPLLDPIQHALFNYPSSYGEHKYAISTVHSCTSPVYFSDYQVVLKEIQDFYMNSSNFPSVLRYLTEGGESFGGNFSTQKRKSYFDHRDDEVEVPCGFMKNFPVSDSDRLAMENCRGVVVASAIFDDHDKIRQPRENADMALSKHPHNIHTIEEAIATARWKKWGDVELLRMQMETYCENGLQPWTPDKLPYASDVPDTALILRKHGLASNLWSCLVFNELEAFNPRDQLAFAYVRDLMRPQIKINMFEVEAFEHIAVEYRHNLKRGVGGGPDPSEGQKRIKMPIRGAINGSRCERYLLTMWGEPHDS